MPDFLENVNDFWDNAPWVIIQTGAYTLITIVAISMSRLWPLAQMVASSDIKLSLRV